MTDRFALRRHWGADLLDDGTAVFRLWAPGMERLSLVHGDGDATLPMEAAGDGWFDLRTDRVAPGDRYSFLLPDGATVPDPAARAQADDVHGPSVLADPRRYRWRNPSWRGRPWEEAVVYELHTGTFSPEGTFAGVEKRLDHLAGTGITALEIMPVAQFGGARGWGYDGVLLYAPHHAYGGPDGFKALIDAAHERELMVLLDVVYNHFGPDGNYLHLYAPEFFDSTRQTPWGAAIAYDRPPVREFFVDNVLYWLEEYRLDGLRFDAINEIQDPSDDHLLEEIARTVRARIPDRHIHLTTEDNRNITRLHERDAAGTPALFTAAWNDDFHHAAHVIATGESEGYYTDYTVDHVGKLARALSEGFAYQGETAKYWGDTPRGVPSAHLPPVAFVQCLQNHDQVGNRAFSERLTDLAAAPAVEALTAILLLCPSIPLMFMGEEWGETNGFGYFTDFDGDLACAVREGRRHEFRRFARFADEAVREKIPDPNADGTFLASRLDWAKPDRPPHRERLNLVRTLLGIRRKEIVPRLSGIRGHAGRAETEGDRAFCVSWRLGDGAALIQVANLSGDAVAVPFAPRGRVLFETAPGVADAAAAGGLPRWSVAVLLDEAQAE